MKHLIVVILIVMITKLSDAQQFDGELIIGMNTSQIDGDESSGYKKIGAIAGIYVRTNFTENWAIQSGIHYCGKGSKLETEDASGSLISSKKVNLHYIEVPCIIRYTYKKKLYFDFGISAAYLFASKLEEDGYEWDKNQYSLRNIDWAINFAMGYHITEHFDIAGRVSNTIPLPCFSVADHKNMPNWYNRSLAICLSYRFDFRTTDQN